MEKAKIHDIVSQPSSEQGADIYIARCNVIGTGISLVNLDGAVEKIIATALEKKRKYVCACNVHSVIVAKDNMAMALALKAADLCLPDGAPIAWYLRRRGFRSQRRVAGPDLMIDVCLRAEQQGLSVFFFGSTEATLAKLVSSLKTIFPKVCVAGWHAPPFRPLTGREDEEVVELINSSGADILWVGLGCPKQEIWMHSHMNSIKPVMVGVGAAFDFHSGAIVRAPLWMQSYGLEWLHRLVSEPRRLFKRYALTNCAFIYYLSREYFQSMFSRNKDGALNR